MACILLLVSQSEGFMLGEVAWKIFFAMTQNLGLLI